MKKLVMILLITALIVSLCACGSSGDTKKATMDSAAVRSSQDAGCSYVASVIDTGKMTASVKEDQDGLHKYWTYTGSEQDDIKADVEVEGKTITLANTSVSELKDLGFDIDPEHEGEKLPPGTVDSLSAKLKGKSADFSVQNNTKETKPVSDLPVFQFYGKTDNKFVDFNYNGLQKGATLQEVIDIFGTPKSNVTVSTTETGTTILLNYISTSTEGDLVISDTLDIYLSYKEADNTAVLAGFSLSCYTEKM